MSDANPQKGRPKPRRNDRGPSNEAILEYKPLGSPLATQRFLYRLERERKSALPAPPPVRRPG